MARAGSRTERRIVSRFYITTPIYYINAEPHLGHAYTTMVADAVARAHRLMGDDVFFLTGTDEHGQKVERAAQKAGLPDAGVRRRGGAEISRPAAGAQHLERRFHPHDGAAALRGRRRRCGGGCATAGSSTRTSTRAGTARSTRCSFPTRSSSTDAVRSAATPSNGSPKRATSSSCRRFSSRCSITTAQHPDFVTPASRRNEMLSFLEAGLEDLSVSRTSFKWGIPVPDDPAHVMYVWFDALTNYMTAVGYGADDPRTAARFETYWPADVHLIGKEIVRQHAIYWPAFLLAAGLAAAAPDRQPRLVADGRREDVEVDGQRRAAAGLHRAVRRSTRSATSSCARWSSARTPSFTDEAILDPVQRRPGQRSRQSRQPGDDDDPSLLRRRGADAPTRRCWREPEERQLLARRRRTRSRSVKAAVAVVPVQRGAARDLGSDRRHQPLHRDARAVEAGEGSGTAGGARHVAVRRRPTPCG